MIKNIIHSGLKLEKDSLDFKKIQLINFIILLAFPFLMLFVLLNYKLNQNIFAIVNVLVIIFFSLAFFRLRQGEQHIPFASTNVLLGMFIIHSTALFQGGILNSGFLWIFLFPLFAIFLKGRTIGMRWIGALLAAIVAMYILILFSYFTVPYDKNYLIFIFLVLSIEVSYVLFSYAIQVKYEKDIASKNRELQILTDGLEERVAQEVQKSRQKDIMLSQQSRMASVGEMMGHISHQWKQPLGTINVLVQNVQLARVLDDQDNDLVDEMLPQILKQTTLMTQTIRDFLSFSKPLDKDHTFSVKNAIENLYGFIGGTLRAKNIDFVQNLTDRNSNILGRENQLIHALMNIVNNAKEVLLSENIQNPRIILSLMVKDEFVELFIEDNAGGIPKEVMPFIFDVYFSTKEASGGTGLGLYMSRQIIKEVMGGTLTVDNGELGARFHITLPLAKV